MPRSGVMSRSAKPALNSGTVAGALVGGAAEVATAMVMASAASAKVVRIGRGMSVSSGWPSYPLGAACGDAVGCKKYSAECSAVTRASGPCWQPDPTQDLTLVDTSSTAQPARSDGGVTGEHRPNS